MALLIVEDYPTDIAGLLAVGETKGWEVDIANTFYQGIMKLTDRKKKYNLIILDMLIPWGQEVSETITELFTEKMVGLYLLQCIRERDDGHKILKLFNLPLLTGRYTNVPVIVLSNYSIYEEKCKEYNKLIFFLKSVYSPTVLLKAINDIINSAKR